MDLDELILCLKTGKYDGTHIVAAYCKLKDIKRLQKQLDDLKDVILEQKEAYELQKVALELKGEVIDELKVSIPKIKAGAVREARKAMLAHCEYVNDDHTNGFEDAFDQCDQHLKCYANQLEGKE